MAGEEGALKVVELWDGWVGRTFQITESQDRPSEVLKDHGAMERVLHWLCSVNLTSVPGFSQLSPGSASQPNPCSSGLT